MGTERFLSLSEVFYIVQVQETHRIVIINEPSSKGVVMFFGRASKPKT